MQSLPHKAMQSLPYKAMQCLPYKASMIHKLRLGHEND